jgi:hypothetical protein
VKGRPIPEPAILLKRERRFYTHKGCRVQIIYHTSMRGEIIEEIELSCLLETFPTSTARDKKQG